MGPLSAPGAAGRPRTSRAYAVILGLAIAVGQLASGSAAFAPTAVAATPTLAQLIGQKLVVRMDGTAPSASLLGRIQRGEVGGVILFGANITTRSALITDGLDGTAASRGLTTARLAYRAAKAGTDMLLVTGSEGTSRGVYTALLADARAGTSPLALLRASWTRVVELKASH